jgi:hypothetical protein
MQAAPSVVPAEASKVITLSSRRRLLLHRLLHRDLRKCSAMELQTLQRRGWVTGAGEGFALTREGREVAELSELHPPDQACDIILP